MGPVNLDWIKMYGEGWAMGRIDVYGTGSDFPEELDLPTMTVRDWDMFSVWLVSVKTTKMYTTQQLVERYETETGRQIRWFKDETE